jgi:TonB family protein
MRVASIAVLSLVVCCSAWADPKEVVAVPVPPAPRDVPTLVQELHAADSRVRAAAAWTLADIPKLEEPVLQALRSALQDPNDLVREGAEWALTHVDGPATYDFGEPPRVRRQYPPQYPQEALIKGIQGTVTVEILVSGSGRVARAEVRKSIPDLDDAALEAVRRWRFSPATRDGRPVPCRMQIPVGFRLK